MKEKLPRDAFQLKNWPTFEYAEIQLKCNSLDIGLANNAVAVLLFGKQGESVFWPGDTHDLMK